VHIEERADFPDLCYVERYYKYVQARVDPVFGSEAACDVEFHVTMRDQLFARSSCHGGAVLGYYSASDKRIFIRPSRWLQGRPEESGFHVVLLHEYAHLRVHDLCATNHPPKWFDEGLAQLLSEDFGPDWLLLRSLREKCMHIPNFRDACFSTTHGDPAIAYLQSHAMVRQLAEECTPGRLVGVLRAMGQGVRFDDAFESTLGLSLSAFDDAWWRMLGEQ
jgi:hypothetical protein